MLSCSKFDSASFSIIGLVRARNTSVMSGGSGSEGGPESA